MTLSSKQVRHLRSRSHHLDPLVQLGKGGYGPTLTAEVDRNLADHELIKVRISADDRHEFAALADRLAADTGAALVQKVGRIVVLYRAGEEPRINLAKAP